MVLFEPEEGAADQEVPHLVPPVVEDVAFPFRMEALARVLVLVEVCAVEIDQAMRVARKVGWHPVQDHADIVLVQMVHQVHEVLGRSVPARRREKARHLVSPGTIEGMLHHRHQLHVGEVHLLRILGQLVRGLPVGERTAHFFGHPAPGAEMDLVDGLGRVERVPAAPGLHPVFVVPFIVELADNGGCLRRHLCIEAERVGLVEALALVV